jgi:hypothetical protein
MNSAWLAVSIREALADPAILAAIKPITDAGGFVLSALFMLSVVILISTGKLVPGYVYQREIDRADKATAMAAKAVDGLTAVATQTESLSKLLEGFIAGRPRRT